MLARRGQSLQLHVQDEARACRVHNAHQRARSKTRAPPRIPVSQCMQKCEPQTERGQRAWEARTRSGRQLLQWESAAATDACLASNLPCTEVRHNIKANVTPAVHMKGGQDEQRNMSVDTSYGKPRNPHAAARPRSAICKINKVELSTGKFQGRRRHAAARFRWPILARG